MKNYQFKWLLLSIILSLASITTAGAYTYTPTGVGQQAAQTQQTMQSQQPAIQSHQMMHGGSSYKGQVYTPFSGEVPSSQSSPARISGPRRVGEGDNWVPDAPDIEYAGDTGNSNESPIGEPWIMALFAMIFAGMIAIRQYKRKTIKSMNMKNSTKYIATLALLCSMGVANMWADNEGFFGDGAANVTYTKDGDDDGHDLDGSGTSSKSLGTIHKQLKIKSAWAKIWKNSYGNISTITLYYRVYPTGSASGKYSTCNLSYDNQWDGGSGKTNQYWKNDNVNVDLTNLSTCWTPGSYTIQYYFKSTGYDHDLNNGGDTYTATFTFDPYYYLVGEEGEGWSLSWGATLSDTGNKMTNNGSGIFSKTISSVTKDNHIFKIAALDWTYNWNYDAYDASNSHNVYSASNVGEDNNFQFQPVIAGDVTIYFNANTHKIYIVCASPVVNFDKEGGSDGDASQNIFYHEATSAITKPALLGHDFSGYWSGDNGTGTQIINSTGEWISNISGYTTNDGKWDITAASTTLYAKWTPANYTITLNNHSATSAGTESANVTYNSTTGIASNISVPSKTGYTFGGYWTGENGTGTMLINASGVWQTNNAWINNSGQWVNAGNVELHAKWTPITYAVVFNGNGSTSGSMANQGFTYDVAQSLTANAFTKDGYYFVGWATTAEGVKAYDDRQSVSNLRSTSGNFDLYAKWAKSELTNLTFIPSSPAPEGDVAITPVFDHEPTGTTIICYELHSNSTATAEVPGTTFAEGGDSKVHFNAPSASGTYYVKATFRAGGSCSGTVLNTIVVPIVISSDHTVTVRYMCDGVAIHAPSEYVVPAGGTLEITALTGDDVFGYTFDSWALGDGINQESVDGGTITISAFFNGVLTANYTKKNIIYFKNTLGWSEVYVNLLTGSWWNSDQGTGNNTLADDKSNKQMNLVPGTTDVYYYIYGNTATTKYVSFVDRSLKDYVGFEGTTENPVRVCYPTIPNPNNSQTEMDYFGFYSNTPMFVPADYPGDLWNHSKAMYYSSGYWTKYTPGTGYYVRIYDPNNDTKLIKRVEMVSENDLIPMTATIDLEANKTYFFEIEREGQEYYSNGNNTMTYADRYGRGIPWEFYRPSTYKKTKITTTAAGSYIFHMTHAGNQEEHDNSDVWRLRVAVEYPISNGDYRLIYKDDTHPNGKASSVVTNAAGSTDIVSFFVRNDQNPRLYIQKSTVADNGSITWAEYPTPGTPTNQITGDIASAITEYGVYNFNLVMDESGDMTVASAEPYEGNFYIRVDVANNKWDNYRDAAHVMAYSDFSISNSNSGEKYSHYWMKYCTGGENVKFVVANDYSPAISDTIVQQSPEVAHIDANGDNSALVSIRFSYNMKTNVAKRTYLAASSESSDFLVLQNSAAASSGNFTDANGTDKGGVDIKFSDKENYIYDITAKVKPNANVRVKVFAHYNTTYQNFIGNHNVATFDDDSDSKLLLSGSGPDLQTIRILYDFKTNRLVSAWQAAGTTTGELKIDADLMIVRKHQEAADNIILAYDDLTDKDGKITTDKRIYAVMRFNRWILNNLGNPEDKEADHAHTDNYTTYHPALEPRYQLPTYERNLYYISFPFDVNVSDIFGFGTYGTHYAIQRYDGIGRAKNGYWVDSDPNWKWVPPTGKLNAYEGYVLSLSLSNMYVTNTNVWANNCSEVELYFPSAEEGFTIDTKDVTIAAINGEGSEYKCTINRGTSEGDRRIKDSYWRCIGVPSFANYETALTSDGSTTINWQPASKDENDEGTIPFIYNINWNDKSLTAYEGSTFPFKAMHSYLVQYGGGIHWSNVVVSSPSPASVVARKRNENTSEHTYCLKLMQGDTFGDQTFVRMTDKEGVTSGFDFDQDLWKQKFANRANIYTFIGYEQVAGNSMPMSEQTTVVPVGVQIAADGEYTFVMPEGTNGTGVYLVDNIAGTRTNLALTDYSVNLTAGTYDGRFFLEISPIAQTPTDVEHTSADDMNGVRKVMVDGVLYILRDGQVFDARGQRVE